MIELRGKAPAVIVLFTIGVPLAQIGIAAFDSTVDLGTFLTGYFLIFGPIAGFVVGVAWLMTVGLILKLINLKASLDRGVILVLGGGLSGAAFVALQLSLQEPPFGRIGSIEMISVLIAGILGVIASRILANAA